MIIDLKEGYILYDNSNARPFIRGYWTNDLPLRDHARDSIKSGIKGKQPSREYLLLNIKSGVLEIINRDSIEKEEA